MKSVFAKLPTAVLRLRLCLIAFAVVSYGTGLNVPAGEFRKDRLLLFPRQGADSPALQKLHARAGRHVLQNFRGSGEWQVIQLAPGEKFEEAVQHYRDSGLVEWVEPDYKLHATDILPNDPEFVGGTQWSLRNGTTGRDLHAVEGWQTLNSASNIVVAIVDSGIRYTHEDLAANIWVNPKEIPDNGIDDDGNGIIDDVHGINAIDSSGKVMDDAGHGTHVAGIIGAAGNNGVGISGIAWQVQLMACKFLDNAGDGDTADAIRCIDYARKNGAHIINASWGGTDYSTALNTAIAAARAAGIIVVTAAGNDSVNIDNTPLYPASYTLDNIVVVGGTSRADILDTGYSNYGPLSVDLCAPGTGIYSTWNSWDGAYMYLSGTSMAAPHVAGVLALMKARFPLMTSSQLISRLFSTVDVLPALAGKCKTSGRVNLARALGTDPTASFTAGPLSGEPPLSVNFTNLTLGSLERVSWDFGDNTPRSTNANPIHVFADSGIFTVRLTVVGTNHRTNSFDQTIRVAPNYQIESEQFAWLDPVLTNALSLADNGIAGPLALPFNFEFYQEKYSAIYVGANGLLAFNPNALGTTDNTTLPSAATPNAIVCPYWDNLNPAAGGGIYTGLVGNEPFRRFVVSWVGVPRNSTAVSLTFQAILEEGSNQIVFQYLETHPETTRGGGRRATVGVENADGSMAALYAFNGVPKVLTNESALRISPLRYRYLVAQDGNVSLRLVRGQAATSATAALHIRNPGNLDLAWQLTGAPDWLIIGKTSGALSGAETNSIPFSLSGTATNLPVGTYTGVLQLKNVSDGQGDTEIPVLFEVEAAKAVLGFGTLSGDTFTGGVGGPFDPSVLTLELRNLGNIPVTWTETSDVSWLTVEPPGGQIQPGQAGFVEITLGDQNLPSGASSGKLQFQNQTQPQSALQQPIVVQVRSHVQETSASYVDGVFSGQLVVPAGNIYQVEYSGDLETWAPLETTPVVSGTSLKFQDAPTDGAQRFYRVRVN